MSGGERTLVHIAGTVRDANGETVGTFTRTANFNGDEISGPFIEHRMFSLDEAHRNRGIGSAFLAESIGQYRDAGFEEIRMTATSYETGGYTNGPYTWARAGFDFDIRHPMDRSMFVTNIGPVATFLDDLQPPDDVNVGDDLDAVTAQAAELAERIRTAVNDMHEAGDSDFELGISAQDIADFRYVDANGNVWNIGNEAMTAATNPHASGISFRYYRPIGAADETDTPTVNVAEPETPDAPETGSANEAFLAGFESSFPGSTVTLNVDGQNVGDARPFVAESGDLVIFGNMSRTDTGFVVDAEVYPVDQATAMYALENLGDDLRPAGVTRINAEVNVDNVDIVYGLEAAGFEFDTERTEALEQLARQLLQNDPDDPTALALLNGESASLTALAESDAFNARVDQQPPLGLPLTLDNDR